MKTQKTPKEHIGKVSKSARRVSDDQADRCERSLDFYLDKIIKWHPGYKETEGRAAAVERIGRTLSDCEGRTFIEVVFLTWRYSMELRARVLEIRAGRIKHAAPGNNINSDAVSA